MLEHTSFSKVSSVDEPDALQSSLPVSAHAVRSNGGDFHEILALAREAGMLITLDAQIGRQTYNSVTGSLSSLARFADALRMVRLERIAS